MMPECMMPERMMPERMGKRFAWLLLAGLLPGQSLACVGCPESECRPDEAAFCSGQLLVQCRLRENAACTYHDWVAVEDCSSTGGQCTPTGCEQPIACPEATASFCEGNTLRTCLGDTVRAPGNSCLGTGTVCREYQYEGERHAACVLDSEACSDEAPNSMECRGRFRVNCLHGLPQQLYDCGPYQQCAMVAGVALCSLSEQVATEVAWKSIPGGSFQPGSPERRETAEPVSVAAFELAEREVTFGSFWECVTAGDCAKPMPCIGVEAEDLANADVPAVCLNPRQAEEYCRHVGGRLPTSREWEFAARNAGADVRYPWQSDDFDCGLSVVAKPADGEDECPYSAPVAGCSLASDITEQGVCDLVGNVQELVLATDDWFEYGSQGANYKHIVGMGVYTVDEVGASARLPRVGFRCAR